MRIFHTSIGKLLLLLSIPLTAQLASGQVTNPAGVTETHKSSLQAHAIAVQAHLSSALAYVDALEQQLKADVPLTEPVVKSHVDMHVRDSQSALKNAKVHITEYFGTMSRAPAAERSDSKSSAEIQANIDKAIRLNDSLAGKLQDIAKPFNKDALRKEVSQLRTSVKDSLSDAKSLKYGD